MCEWRKGVGIYKPCGCLWYKSSVENMQLVSVCVCVFVFVYVCAQEFKGVWPRTPCLVGVSMCFLIKHPFYTRGLCIRAPKHSTSMQIIKHQNNCLAIVLTRRPRSPKKFSLRRQLSFNLHEAIKSRLCIYIPGESAALCSTATFYDDVYSLASAFGAEEIGGLVLCVVSMRFSLQICKMNYFIHIH